MAYTIEVNGRHLTVNDTSGSSLLSVLRDELGLTGARFGCGHGKCGACVVLVDEQPIPACTYPAADAIGKSVVTIEGLAQGDTLHPVQRAFLDEGAMQCGYCTSGMILAGTALLRRVPAPNDAQIREALAPHLCRCGVYLRAIRAVKRAAR
jgi:aerobic-type carbon monoxide dehydrogenase small subunit (CoxS/CutS family)